MWIIFSSLALVFTFTSEANDIQFERNQGLGSLPKNTIWTITQDNKGYIWMGSDAGLFRYDGYEVSSLTQLIPTGNTIKVRSLVAADGVLWVGTKGQGLYKIANTLIPT